MSVEPLYPEDILNYVPTLRDRALLAKEEADAVERAEKDAKREQDTADLVSATIDFMVEDLSYPAAALEDVEFKTVIVQDMVRIEWTIEDIRLRAEHFSFNGQRRTKFSVKSGVAQYGEAWKEFHDLVSLGRLID